MLLYKSRLKDNKNKMNWKKQSLIKKELRKRHLDRLEDKAMGIFLAIIFAGAFFIFIGHALGFIKQIMI
jgi:nitrate reductase gamma subunit